MFQWISENAGTIITCAALAALAVWIIVRLRKDRKQGKSACGGNCGCCPMSGSCHKPS